MSFNVDNPGSYYQDDLQELYGLTKAQREGNAEMLRRAKAREQGKGTTEKELEAGK